MWTSRRANRCSRSSSAARVAPAVASSDASRTSQQLRVAGRIEPELPRLRVAHNVDIDRLGADSYRPLAMPRPHYALALLALLAWPLAAGGQTSLTPHAGLLVLRNGQVLEGEITQAGDYYIVTLGGTSEIRIKASEVEAVCGSLDEA